ncbi:hypothetical protein [Streptomyces sp. NPDC007094]|uniref:hypothetical protein n=1 Tax=Streptomyces sp. NPDC007094 TaxID=3155359 RepID=UPI0033C11855
MPLPEGIPTVRLTGRFLTPDGRPLAGQVVVRAPNLVTFGEFDVILGGPVTAPLDSTGAFEVELPATDAPGMNPSGWSYQVAEQLTGVPANRIYQILLPAEAPEVDLADIAPTDPSTPTYVAVRGDSAYEVAVADGFEGTVEQWLASLVGPQGIQGAPGSRVYPGPVGTGVGVDGDMSYNLTNGILYWREGGSWVSKGTFLGPKGDKGETGSQGIQGDTGPTGAPGVVQSVNGISTAAVVLAAADVGAATADHTHTPAAVGALAATARAAANGVASLDTAARVPIAQMPTAIGRNVWTPQSLGFQAWSVDPAAVANPVQKPAVVGRIYLSGILITEPTPVNRVVIHARGWGGSALVPAARFWAGIYNEAGSRVATSGQVSNLPAAGQISGTAPGAVNNHIGAVPVPLTATATLQPGRYWAAFLMSAGASTDFYYMHIQNESPSNPGNFYLGSTAFQRHWCIPSGQTSLPTTVNQATGEVGLDPAVMALALV